MAVLGGNNGVISFSLPLYLSLSLPPSSIVASVGFKHWVTVLVAMKASVEVRIHGERVGIQGYLAYKKPPSPSTLE